MTKTMLKSLNGCYTNLLKRVKNLDWRNHPTLHEIYRGLPRISSVLTSRMLSFSGHFFRVKHEIISDILLWCPAGLKPSRKRTFLDILKRETGLDVEELDTVMADRERWREEYCLFLFLKDDDDDEFQICSISVNFASLLKSWSLSLKFLI